MSGLVLTAPAPLSAGGGGATQGSSRGLAGAGIGWPQLISFLLQKLSVT